MRLKTMVTDRKNEIEFEEYQLSNGNRGASPLVKNDIENKGKLDQRLPSYVDEEEIVVSVHDDIKLVDTTKANHPLDSAVRENSSSPVPKSDQKILQNSKNEVENKQESAENDDFENFEEQLPVGEEIDDKPQMNISTKKINPGQRQKTDGEDS